jgi:hypothetical protein
MEMEEREKIEKLKKEIIKRLIVLGTSTYKYRCCTWTTRKTQEEFNAIIRITRFGMV